MRRPDAGAANRIPGLRDLARQWSDEGVTAASDLLVAPDADGPPGPWGPPLAEVSLVTGLLALNRAHPGRARTVPRASLAAAVRTSLGRLADAHPGHLVEVRVPPFAAVQVGVPGVASVHRRGTPPHVVETDPESWLALLDGSLDWADAVASGHVRASGVHADLRPLLGR